MSLPTYSSFEEKAQNFNLLFPRNLKELVKTTEGFRPQIVKHTFWGKDFLTEKRFLFRGVNNSSYKMFSSIQRCLDYRADEYKQKITLSNLLNEIFSRFHNENGGFLYEEHRKQMPKGTMTTHPSIWAFIQHFGGPSPLLDFTSDAQSALFFAFDNMKEPSQDDSMSEYVSLIVFPDNPMRTGESTSMYASTSDIATTNVIEHEQKYGEKVDTDAVLIECMTQPLHPMMWGSMVYGNDKSYHSFRVPDADNSEVRTAVDNINISAQMGNFFQGNLTDMQPLENSPIFQQANPYGKYGTSIEIPKSFFEEIKATYKIPAEYDVYPEKHGRLKPLYDAMGALWKPLVSEAPSYPTDN